MQSSKPDQDRRSPLVCLLAAPATSPSVLYGLYDVLASAGVVYGEMTTGGGSACAAVVRPYSRRDQSDSSAQTSLWLLDSRRSVNTSPGATW